MALKSTVCKADLSISDIDHAYYADHSLTLARHPSETEERMMVRLVAFALQAHKLKSVCQGDGVLAFGAGLSDPNEPDVWLRDFTQRPRVWIEIGQPEEKRLAKACGKADEVLVYAYHQTTPVWWETIRHKIARLKNLQVWQLSNLGEQTLTDLCQRNMQLQALIQKENLLLSHADGHLEIELAQLL